MSQPATVNRLTVLYCSNEEGQFCLSRYTNAGDLVDDLGHT